MEKYPLPKVEDIFAAIGGSTIFSKIDLLHAYLQMRLDEGTDNSAQSTHNGLYQYKRLPFHFGVSSAPAIWLRVTEQVLQGVPKTQCLLDDIIIAEEEHLQIIEEVLARLDKYGMTLNKAKHAFFKSQIEYCGHLINAEGLHKSQEKIKALSEAPTLQDISQLRAFLG